MLPFYVRHEVSETPTTDKLVLIPTFVKFLRVIPLSLPHSITLTYQHLSHTPMIPSEEANAALNDTLTDVQSLIKRCMKLKEGDSATALALSDEIARRLVRPVTVDCPVNFGLRTSFVSGKRFKTLWRERNIVLSTAAVMRSGRTAVH